MYNFAGMDYSLKPFRHLVPADGYQLRALSWSPTGDRFLSVTGSAQFQVFDRDGRRQGESVKGDIYIRDLKQTKGHIMGLTSGQWNPNEKNKVVTASEDGSVRLWDMANLKQQETVMKPTLAKQGRLAVTSCSWSRDGRSVGAGLSDSSLQIWSKGNKIKPDFYIKQAHAEDITCVSFSTDMHTLVSRSLDSTLKVWDIRQYRTHLGLFKGLPCTYAQTAADFNPDDKLIFTGTEDGRLVFIDKKPMQVAVEKDINEGSIVCCLWHPRLYQLLLGTGCRTRVTYDPRLSAKGALLCVKKAPKKRDSYCQAVPQIRNPHALPMFRDEPSRKRQRMKARADPAKSKKPEPPVNGPGHGGRMGYSAGSLLVQHLMVKETWRDEDPQQALLKYAEEAEKNPMFITPAYARTQPVPIFADDEAEELV